MPRVEAFLLLVGFASVLSTARAIEDPFNIFCGSKDCYDILQIEDRSAATSKDIKKAYRRLSVQYHPDKNKSPDAVVMFRELAKAVEVLEDEKTREDYDYYLTHPWDYYKVTGKHYFRKLPDADIRLIVAGVVLFLSVLLPVVQHQRYMTAINYLTTATLNNLPLRNGGSKQTMELFQRASDLYEAHLREAMGSKFDKSMLRIGKMQKDPQFATIVKNLVGDVQIEGGYRKPTITDIFAVRVVLFPWWTCLYIARYYKRNYTPEKLSNEEKEEWAIERVSPGHWNSLSREVQLDLMHQGIWKQEVYDAWLKSVEEDEVSKRPTAYKQYRRYIKKNPTG